MQFRLALLALLVLPSLAHAADKVVVFPLKPKLGVTPAVAEVVNDTFVSALQSRGVQVITQKDVENMLRLEQKKADLNVAVAQKLGEDGCSADTECLTQIGGALGARFLVTGSLSKLGKSLQFTAELMDQLKGKVVERFNGISKKAGDEAYFELAQQAAAHLFPGEEAAAPKLGSEVSFGSGAQIAVPTFDASEVGSSGLGELNIEAEKLLEAALDAQDRKDPPVRIQAAWCKLAALTKNPYEKKAKEACEGWTKYAEAEKALEKDHANLEAYLGLKRKTREQKLAVVTAFLDAYGSVANEKVAWAVSAKRRLEEGEGIDAASGNEFVEPKSGLTFVRIPAGSFNMGCVPGDSECDSNKRPPTRMSVQAFSLGKTEVTVQAYAKCAQAGACSVEPQWQDFSTKGCNWKNGRMDHPMNCLNWKEARAFCHWLGGRLPDTTEWEYASKAGRDVTFPWGNEPLDGTQANFCDRNCPEALNSSSRKFWEERGRIDPTLNDGWAGTAPVGTYSRGTNRWGLLDMAGNVTEWTASAHTDKDIETRGGGWYDPAVTLRTSSRSSMNADARNVGIGFRCAL